MLFGLLFFFAGAAGECVANATCRRSASSGVRAWYTTKHSPTYVLAKGLRTASTLERHFRARCLG